MTLVLTLPAVSPDTWSIPITDEPQLVGRAKSADICLESVFVSKEHCRFWMESGRCHVEDCGSRNGTFVRGRQIDRAVVASGDRVIVGSFELLVADEEDIQPTDYDLPSSETLFNQTTLSQPVGLEPPPTLSEPATEERRLASIVHQRLTPSRRIGLPGMLVEVAYIPSGLLGGDCFECFELNDRCVLALFDSMSHGTKAALMNTLIRSELHRWVSLTAEPGKCLEHLNRELVEMQIDDLYVCASLAMWFPATSTMVYSTAGQQPPLFVRGGKVTNANETAGGYPLGTVAGGHFEEKLLQLTPQDRLYFFTDGLSDVLRGNRETRSSAGRIADKLLQNPTESLTSLARSILKSNASEAQDDALLVGCEVVSLPKVV